MKFFSLLKEDIHLKDKIIPKEDFTTLLEASEILEKVKSDIKTLKKQTLDECEILKKQAEEKGFEEGLEKLNEHIFNLDEAIKNLNEEYAKKILPIALKTIKKLIPIELKTNPQVIIDIIKKALKPVSNHLKIKVFVNKEDFEIIEKEKEKIKEILELNSTLTLDVRDDIEKGGCIIETEKGIINAQLENNLRAIEAAYKKFTK